MRDPMMHRGVVRSFSDRAHQGFQCFVVVQVEGEIVALLEHDVRCLGSVCGRAGAGEGAEDEDRDQQGGTRQPPDDIE